MATKKMQNWFGDVVSYPKNIVEVKTVDDIIAVLTNCDKYPSPVRPVGSNHSITKCAVAEGGTVLKMTRMNRIINISNNTVTVEAGALYIDVANALAKQGLQFYVNTEIGNLTLGSAACVGTKDASMPGEFGQVNSYISGIKMVLPSGECVEITDDFPELMQFVRCSYGLFGVIYQVTIRVRPIQPMAVRYKIFRLPDLEKQFSALLDGEESMMFYLYPFQDLVMIEFRRYVSHQNRKLNRAVWHLRNYSWRSITPKLCYVATKFIPIKSISYGIIDMFNAFLRFMSKFVQSSYTLASDQIIRYPHLSTSSRYTFSFWAFAEDKWVEILPQYFAFCRNYYEQHGYRCNMLDVGYRVAKDQSSLFSYTYHNSVITIDPVSTANAGWFEFLEAFNEFCSERGGIPLFNQTYKLTPAQVLRAFGNRLEQFEVQRKRFDPNNRLLNGYFCKLLSL